MLRSSVTELRNIGYVYYSPPISVDVEGERPLNWALNLASSRTNVPQVVVGRLSSIPRIDSLGSTVSSRERSWPTPTFFF